MLSPLCTIQHLWAIVVYVADQPVGGRHAHAVRFEGTQQVDWRPRLVVVGKRAIIVPRAGAGLLAFDCEWAPSARWLPVRGRQTSRG